MSKHLYAGYRATLLDNGTDLISGDVKISMHSASYVQSDAHNFHDDLTDIISTSSAVASKTATDGYFDFADISVGSPAGGNTGTQFTLWLDSGSSATSPLIYWWDEDASGSAISIATNGEAITVVVPSGGLFRV